MVPQEIEGTSSASLEAFDVSDADGIARVWAVLRPPGFGGGSTDNPVTELLTVEMTETSPGSHQYAGTFDGFTAPGSYLVAIYAMDKTTNTSTPRLTSVTVGNPLTRRVVLVAGGSSADASWAGVESAARATYQALKFQGYQDSQIDYLSATTVSGPERLNTLDNLAYALATAQHADSQDVLVVLVGTVVAGAFPLNAAESVSVSRLDGWLDALQVVVPGKITVVMDAAASGAFVAGLSAPTGFAGARTLIASTSGSGPAYFASSGAVSFSRQLWQQIANGARLRDAFVQARNAMRTASGGAQSATLYAK
jgi:hypothetical protein